MFKLITKILFIMNSNVYNLVSLFSGVGGMDLGFRLAGFNTIWANENDSTIWESYRTNHPNVFLDTRSIRDVEIQDIPDCHGLIGGPPCQSWSEGGKMLGFRDSRGKLFLDYIRIVKEKQPLFFVAENVPGLLQECHKEAFKTILSLFDEAGYTTSYMVMNASDYAIPQDRKRIIFVGYRNDLDLKFVFPEKTTSINKITLRQAIGDIEEIPICVKSGQVLTKQTNSKYLNHEYFDEVFSDIYMSRNRVRSWNEISFTIQALAKNAPIHPQAPKMEYCNPNLRRFAKGYEHLYRRLSVRECARIQTFPDSFILQYSNIEAGYRMVGNAVPVRLAHVIANQIFSQLSSKKVDSDIYDIKPNLNSNNIYDKIPGDDDLILVAYYKNEKHLKWILDNKLYNIRVKSHNQEKNVLNSCRNTQYLILYHYSGAKDSYIFSLKENSVQVVPKSNLINLNYPGTPSSDKYVIMDLDRILSLQILGFKEFKLMNKISSVNYPCLICWKYLVR